MRGLCFVALFLTAGSLVYAVDVAAVTDYTNYNVGDEVRLRLTNAAKGMASIRYAGDDKPVASGIQVSGTEYQDFWKIPADARTGRYVVDFGPGGTSKSWQVTSFAVHRQLAKVISVDLDKTFYTNGDAINARIVVKNLSDRKLDDIQVEFEPYTYPWIAPEPDELHSWKYLVARSLTLGPGEEKVFEVKKATVAQVEHNEPEALYYSVVIRNSRQADRIYDLAFAPPAFTVPPNRSFPKQYPFLYLYWRLKDVPKSESYREFYPPDFVSDVIRFDTTHTMFPLGTAADLHFSVKPRTGPGWQDAKIRARIFDQQGREIRKQFVDGAAAGAHQFDAMMRTPGLYRVAISVEASSGAVLARNQLELAANKLPKSILIFLAHQDDDTAHPALIRAAVENHIPIHFVYLTGGDAGGCDRFYMHSCDAARAMDFGEVRMGEARASLGHLGVPSEDIEFLGLPDGGLEQIWFHHKSSQKPYLSVLLASDHSPYKEAEVPNLAYARDAIIAVMKDRIMKYRPEMIVTGHPDERHVDHRTNNWLAVKAMQELLRDGKLSRDTELLVDVSYGAKAGRHAPYRFEKDTFYASGEAAKLGQEALWYYESQDGNHQQAEIKDFKDLPRTEAYPHVRVLDWWEHAGWNEAPERK
jgi:LmbE family N-acetylglucosaminyl deacetylase